MRDKSKKGTLLWVLDKTSTSMGGRLLRRWINDPLLDVEEIVKRQDSVEELNKTQAEKKLIQQENARKQRDRELELERKKEKEKQERRNKRRGIKTEVKVDNTEVDIFGDVIKEDSSDLFSEEALKQVVETKVEKKDGDNDENLNLF